MPDTNPPGSTVPLLHSLASHPLALLLLVLTVVGGTSAAAAHAPPGKKAPPGNKTQSGKKAPSQKRAGDMATDRASSQQLFDGKTLDGWKTTRFGGEGEVTVQDGKIIMEMGNPLTGITFLKPLPKTNYEINLKAMRLDGIDFFCALTFPVEDSHCTFVVGGWAGAVVGISCIDGYDASQNRTTRYESFKSNRWYQIRVRVTNGRLQAWIDGKQMVDVDTTKHKLATRIEVDLCKPFGIASYVTSTALRDIRIRKLEPAQGERERSKAPVERPKS